MKTKTYKKRLFLNNKTVSGIEVDAQENMKTPTKSPLKVDNESPKRLSPKSKIFSSKIQTY